MAPQTFRIHDLQTNQTIEPGQLAPLRAGQILILPTESAAELAELQIKWRTEFPGDSHRLRTLLSTVIIAEWQQRRAQTDLQQFQLEAYSTHMPMHRWDQQVLENLHRIQAHQDHADREFTRALEAVQSAYTAHALNEKIKRETPPEPDTERRKPVLLRQNLKVEIIDGQLQVINDFPAAEIWAKQPWPDNIEFSREFYFPTSEVPEPYAWVLTHEGVTHQPTRFVSIFYSHQEFLRLAKLELDTNSEFVLDGDRLRVARRD